MHDFLILVPDHMIIDEIPKQGSVSDDAVNLSLVDMAMKIW